MRRPFPVLLLAAALLFPVPARAIFYIDINAPGGKRMPIALPSMVTVSGDPRLSAIIPKTISEDLGMTSFFDVIPPEAYLEKILPSHFGRTLLSFPDWKMIGAEAVVIGRVWKDADERGKIRAELRLYDSTLGNMIVGKVYKGSQNQIRTIAHKFANEILYSFTGLRGIFDTEIAFTATPEGGRRNKEVFVVGLDGQEPRQITDNRSFNLFPRWSPNGNLLAYTSYRTGVPVIYLRNMEEGTDRALVKFGNTKSPGCFSPGGDSLYVSVSTEGNSDIYRVRLGDGGIERVVEGWGIEVSPSLSPDGKKIAFVSNRGGSPQVYVRDTAASSGERRVSNAGGYSTSPSWSPDGGNRIAFTSQEGGKFSLYTVNSDGSDQRLLASGDGDCTDPAFSPDGRYVVYTFQKKGYSELRIISADGRWGRRLISGLSGLGSPSWSPRR